MVGVDEITQVEEAPEVRGLVAMFPGEGRNQASAFNRQYGTFHLLRLDSCTGESGANQMT